MTCEVCVVLAGWRPVTKLLSLQVTLQGLHLPLPLPPCLQAIRPYTPLLSPNLAPPRPTPPVRSPAKVLI